MPVARLAFFSPLPSSIRVLDLVYLPNQIGIELASYFKNKIPDQSPASLHLSLIDIPITIPTIYKYHISPDTKHRIHITSIYFLAKPWSEFTKHDIHKIVDLSLTLAYSCKPPPPPEHPKKSTGSVGICPLHTFQVWHTEGRARWPRTLAWPRIGWHLPCGRRPWSYRVTRVLHFSGWFAPGHRPRARG